MRMPGFFRSTWLEMSAESVSATGTAEMQRAHRGVAVGVELLALAPHRQDLAVGGVPGVVGEQDARLPQRLPEVGEHRVGRRAVAELGPHRAGLHDDDAGALGEAAHSSSLTALAGSLSEM